MRSLDNSSIAQYAVIEARRAEGPSERFVCIYSDEESLRDLIAKPSIIACGFPSREEAEANIDTRPRNAAWKRIQKAFAFGGAEKRLLRDLVAKPRAGAGRTDNAIRVRDLVESAIAAAAFTFYSRNAVFTVLRSFFGSSI